MRKLFRMKYEKCSGQCYAYSDVMRIHTLGLDVEGTVAFLKRLLAMHAPSCGNESLQFRLDEDTYDLNIDGLVTEHSRFVASFWHYGTLDLFGGASPLDAMNALIDGVMAWYASDEGKELLARDSLEAVRGTVCHHGTDEKLVNFALEFSGLNDRERESVRARFA